MGNLKALRDFNLTGYENTTNVGVQHLASLTYLTMLSLHYCIEISDDGASTSEKLMALRDLNLTSCGKITDVGGAAPSISNIIDNNLFVLLH